MNLKNKWFSIDMHKGCKLYGFGWVCLKGGMSWREMIRSGKKVTIFFNGEIEFKGSRRSGEIVNKKQLYKNVEA